MEELENTLKAAYNSYIDALVNYLTQLKQEPVGTANNATKYIFDNNITVGLRDSYEIVRSASTDKLLAKKVI